MKGISYGEAIITLSANATDKYEAGSTTKTIKVNRINQTVSMSVGSLTLAYGESKQLSVTSQTTPTWTSSNSAYASVNSSGKVTGAYPGNATITASAPANGVYNAGSATCSVTVTKANTSIKLKNAAGTEVDTLTFTYSPTATYYQLTYYISDTVTNTQWGSSNPSVAYFDTTYYGMLYLGNAGTTELKAYWDGNAYYHSAADTITLTINKASQTISWNATKTPINVGATSKFTVSGNATGMYYSSSNTNVATVNASTGLVTGIAAGNATITAYAVGNTNYNASNKITKDIVISKITQTLTKTSTGTSVNVGSTLQLSVSGCNTSLSWRSGNTGVATVNASTGVVTGVSGGTARIYVKATGNTQYNESSEVYFDITVNKLSQTVKASASSSTIYTNTSPKTSTISVTQGYGTPTYTITSGNSYATISGNVVTAKATGTVTVTVTCAGNGTYKEASTTVTINVKYYSTGGSPGNVPSNTDPVSPGGSIDPSGTSTPTSTPTSSPTPSSSPGEGGLWIEINGTRYYGDDTHSTNGSGGPESVTITCSSDVTYSKEKSWEGDFYYVIVKSKNSGQEIFRVALGDTYMTTSAPTEPTPSASASATPTQAATQASTQAATQGATQGSTSKVS